MPSLNPRQFDQQEFPGFHTPEVTPHGFGRRQRAPEPPPPDPNEPSRTYKRGAVGEGQRIMNFDNPDAPLEHDRAGLVPVDSFTDPSWDPSAWRYGGFQRETAAMNPTPMTHDGQRAHVVTDGWGRAPVETIGPDVEIRTNQAEFLDEDRQETTVNKGRLQVDMIDDDMVDVLRGEGDLAFQDPETGEEEFPWVAEVEGKNYLLEGHHRAIAARTRDSGEFPARVLRGANWGQIEEQLYDGPRSR